MRSALRDPVLFALGTLTTIRVPPPRTTDPRVAGGGMALAPMVGALLGSGAAITIWVAGWVDWSPAVAAALALAFLALATRAIHLDGLADTMDALGSDRPAAEALAVMRRGDIGPFGVCAVVFALLIQLAALELAIHRDVATATCIVGLALGRLSLPLGCLRRVPAARVEGLGTTVAGTVGIRGVLGSSLVVLSLAVVVNLTAGGPGIGRVLLATVTVPAVTAGVLRIAVRRFGGITGDVLGAVTEVTTTVALLVLVSG